VVPVGERTVFVALAGGDRTIYCVESYLGGKSRELLLAAQWSRFWLVVHGMVVAFTVLSD
jgi:hypothetical protein